MSFKVLRNFGHTMTEIELKYGPIYYLGDNRYYKISIYDFIDKIEFYLAEYCSKSLKKLLIDECNIYYYKKSEQTKTSFENIEKSFQNVTFIKLIQCYLGPRLLSKVFPNLESLHLMHNMYKKFSVINEHWPKLKELRIRNTYCYATIHAGIKFHVQTVPFQGDEVIEMIKLNPQLEKLEMFILKAFGVARLIHCIREYLPLLKCLHIIYHPSTFPHDLQPLHFNSVEDFHLVQHYIETQRISDINFFKFSSNLKRFSLSFHINFDENHTNSYDPILNFIQKNTDLTSIILYGIINGNLNILFESISPNIEQLEVLRYHNKIRRFKLNQRIYIFMSDVLSFLKCRPSLKKLLIKYHEDNREILRYFRDAIKYFCDDAIPSLSTGYKMISDFKSVYICQNCNESRWEDHKNVEFSLKRRNMTSIRYNCTFRYEYNRNIPEEKFVVIECLKINN